MKMQGNTILITGGGSGIGCGLAEAFHKLGNTVIIAGRREAVLAETAAANPGMAYAVLDTANAASIAAFAPKILAEFPDLNVVINNAGVQRYHDFSGDSGLDEAGAREEIDTNIWGVLRMTDAFLPRLKTRADAAIVNVSSGLAFVPLAQFPVYCATKAFVHSFCLSLRHQLRGSGVRVIELAPPWVETELGATHPPEAMPPGSGTAQGPMPLDAFIAEAMRELESGEDELKVAGAKFLFAGGVGEKQAATFAMINR
jgi:uncharacterized oxidoreductase